MGLSFFVRSRTRKNATVKFSQKEAKILKNKAGLRLKNISGNDGNR